MQPVASNVAPVADTMAEAHIGVVVARTKPVDYIVVVVDRTAVVGAVVGSIVAAVVVVSTGVVVP